MLNTGAVRDLQFTKHFDDQAEDEKLLAQIVKDLTGEYVQKI